MSASALAAKAVHEREMGLSVPVSIGTALALEGAFGILEDKPNPTPIIDSVDVLYVNVRTLIRNMVGAIDPDRLSVIYPEDLASAMVNEMSIVAEAVRSASKGRVSAVFYICSYRSIPKKFKYAILKMANTEKQKLAVIREESTLNELKRIFEYQAPTVTIIDTDIDLKPDPRRALMLTSYAIDLLQKYRFSSLTLIESHTGAAKPPVQWHTKLTNGKELPNIPFDRMTLQFFGDGSNLFTGYPIKYRRVLLAIADQNKWNSLTTKDYIKSCVKKAYEPELEKLINNLYASH